MRRRATQIRKRFNQITNNCFVRYPKALERHYPDLLERVVRLKWPVLRRRRQLRPARLRAQLRVTLTSYRARFDVLGTTLRCLLMQSFAPDEVILWISDADFPHLPADVRELEKFGLRIRVCRDLRSYKKIIPALEEDPSAIWVTADDDCYYSPRWLEELVRAWSPNAKEVICHRAHRIRLGEDGRPLPYKNWQIELTEPSAHALNFFTGVGGVLYPPGCFSSEVLDEGLFTRLCPRADDVWLWWMIRRNGYIVRNTPGAWRQLTWIGSQVTSLYQANVHEGGNDTAVRNLTEHFGFPITIPAVQPR